MNEVEKYRRRRDARMKKRMDEEWVTMKGTHVLIDDDGQVKGGPDRVKKLVNESGGYKKGSKKVIKGAPMFNVTNSRRQAEKGREKDIGGWAKNAKKAEIKTGEWKRQLQEMANEGKMPSFVSGNREQQASVMTEINKIYDKPDVKHRFVDQGDAAWISYMDGTGATERTSYPSGENATQEEKDGVVKFMLHNHIKKYGNDAPTMEQGFEEEGYRKNKEGRWERK